MAFEEQFITWIPFAAHVVFASEQELQIGFFFLHLFAIQNIGLIIFFHFKEKSSGKTG